ncbi:hypothetical protein GCM10022383_25970 [Microbacterium soli]|uniref:Uncharacterized protein n=1 Tax=Microbacterium soli TaxID=446075 RepID=A0ABP7NGW9_9MICO
MGLMMSTLCVVLVEAQVCGRVEAPLSQAPVGDPGKPVPEGEYRIPGASHQPLS